MHATDAFRAWTTWSESAASAVSRSLSTNTVANRTAVVYALSVADQHEYFANGILVSNCDAGLYSWRHAMNYLDFEPHEEKPSRDELIERQDEEALIRGASGTWWEEGYEDEGDFE